MIIIRNIRRPLLFWLGRFVGPLEGPGQTGLALVCYRMCARACVLLFVSAFSMGEWRCTIFGSGGLEEEV